MRQARTVLSTYSADAFGVCSALYELGGMIVMHDASGCNSTYTTHDEPRWFHSDSLVFISGLTEMDAILGNDDKLKSDMLSAIRELHPAFAAVVGTPIPMMTGFDYHAVAAEIEEEAGIPCFGFPTNGMRPYLCGASEALAVFAERMTRPDAERHIRRVNILGATPLDFSLGGTVPSIRRYLSENGWEVVGCWAMDSRLEDLSRAGEAQVNLVISGVGMKAAKVLKRKFGTPYVAGVPIGGALSKAVLDCLEKASADGTDRIAFSESLPTEDSRSYIIGESVVSRSLAAAIGAETGIVPKVVYPLEQLPELGGILAPADIPAIEEEEIREACAEADTVITDPLYKPVLPGTCRFVSLPHVAFSGRMFQNRVPDFTDLKID